MILIDTSKICSNVQNLYKSKPNNNHGRHKKIKLILSQLLKKRNLYIVILHEQYLIIGPAISPYR